MTQPMLISSPAERDRYRDRRLEELKPALSGGRFAIFGGGSHTQQMLASHGDRFGSVAFILDDAPSTDRIRGVPVVRPAQADPAQVVAVLVSSDAYEGQLADRARSWASGSLNPPRVLTIYEGCSFAASPPALSAPPAMVDRGCHERVPEFVERFESGLLSAGMPGAMREGWGGARFYNMLGVLSLTEGVRGWTAEAGCYRGLSSLLICQACRDRDRAFDGSTHLVVDSFRGLSEPTERDGEASMARFEGGAFTDTSVELVRRTLREFPGVVFHEGWIPGVLSEIEERAYRFVHVDVDLYEPVMSCLEYFYPRLAPGGAIVVDDHGPVVGGTYAGCRIACQEFSAAHGVPFAPLSAGNAIFLKRA